MPTAKKASKKKPQATEKAKAEAQNTAQEEKPKAISGASTRIFGKTQEDAEAAINRMHDTLNDALEIARVRALANAAGWNGTCHDHGASLAIPLLTILRSLNANNLSHGGTSGQRAGHKHFLNHQALTDAIQNSTGGKIVKEQLNDLIYSEGQETHATDLHSMPIWVPKKKKDS